ncbi:MAG: hypothetical protein FWG75_02125 [Cystobacterineae bacterium]|nr:hypothetical protein [Cystobacterineae bacterium]
MLYMLMVLLGACALWKNPEAEILVQLKACESKPSWVLRAGKGERPKGLSIQRMFFQRLTVILEEDRKRAHVIATLDIDGVWGEQGGAADAKKEQYIRSLGFERIEFVYEGGAWKAARGCFPELEAVLWFLEGQEAAMKESNTLGWNIRVEREGAHISQEFEKTRQGGKSWHSFFLSKGKEGQLHKVAMPMAMPTDVQNINKKMVDVQ